MTSKKWIVVGIVLAALALLMVAGAQAGPLAQEPQPQGELSPQAVVGTAFTYQGRLTDGGSPASGKYDFRFQLYDAASGGKLLGTVTKGDETVADGLFTVSLSFGEVFTGTARYLAIGVRPGASTGNYTPLTPRQPLTPSPYALALPGLWTQENAYSPNVIGGYGGNSVTAGVVGATIGGGGRSGSINRVTADYATVGGGRGNTASGGDATVGGGLRNTASGGDATVGGGLDNTASGPYATVGGGSFNTAGNFATVGGGNNNKASGLYATIGGGAGNTASVMHATVGGGYLNTASGVYATVGGGLYNEASGPYASIGGGEYISVTGEAATVAGGSWVTATGDYAAVGGGRQNIASAMDATVGGGILNEARFRATVGGGKSNTASGDYATVPGGAGNTAQGSYSFAAGQQAQATHSGSFVWSSGESTSSWGGNTFTVRAHGGVRFYSASGTSSGVELAAGSSGWGLISDRNVKENFADVDAGRVLETLAAMPIQTWNLKAQSPALRHIGPVAQDFNGGFAYLFGEVESATHINSADAIGVALAAAQGLHQVSEEQAARIGALEAENAALKQRVDDLEGRVAALEQRAGSSGSPRLGFPGGWLFLGGLVVAAGVAVQRRRAGGGR